MHDLLLIDSSDETYVAVQSAVTESGPGRVYRATTVAEGLQMVREVRPSVVLAADDLPDGEGTRLLGAANQTEPITPVVLLCDRISTDRIFAGSVAGAYDFLPKPISPESIARLFERLDTEWQRSPRGRIVADDADFDEDEAVGRCPRVLDSFRTAGAAAGTGATVLVRGESGTGKELMARAIHRASGRSGSFVAVNCAAIVDSLAESELYGHERGAFTGASERRAGCFERADRGTLFLDEIGEASAGFQAKLLRALDRGEFYRVGGHALVRPNVRIIAATNRDLEAAVAEDGFRADLFYRLAEVNIHLPPLRERREDIPRLVGRLLSRTARRLNRRTLGMSEDALSRLVAYPWPGNIRELQNVLTRAGLVCRGTTLQTHHLEGLGVSAGQGIPEIPTLETLERNHIERVLAATGGNRGRTCRILGITRPTLRRKMRAYELEAPGSGGNRSMTLDTREGGGYDASDHRRI